MIKDVFKAWQTNAHLRNFTKYESFLKIYTHSLWNNSNIFFALNEIIHNCDSLTEIGHGGGYFYYHLRRLKKKIDYIGFDVSKPCVEYCRKKYGLFFYLVSGKNDPLRKSDCVFFCDVAVHQKTPLEFIKNAASYADKYLLFYDRTRDIGKTEYDYEKSCCYENGYWIPFIVFNVSEMVNYLLTLGFVKIVVIKNYNEFAGKADRYLPKDLYGKQAKTARTTFLAIREEGLEGLNLSGPLFLEKINVLERKETCSKIVKELNYLYVHIKDVF